MQGQAQVVVAVLEQQGLGLLHQVAAQRPLQLQHLLRAESRKRSPSHLAGCPLLLQAGEGGRGHLNTEHGVHLTHLAGTLDEWICGWLLGDQKSGWTNAQTVGHMNGCIDECLDRRSDGVCEWTDEWKTG